MRREPRKISLGPDLALKVSAPRLVLDRPHDVAEWDDVRDALDLIESGHIED